MAVECQIHKGRELPAEPSDPPVCPTCGAPQAVLTEGEAKAKAARDEEKAKAAVYVCEICQPPTKWNADGSPHAEQAKAAAPEAGDKKVGDKKADEKNDDKAGEGKAEIPGHGRVPEPRGRGGH